MAPKRKASAVKEQVNVTESDVDVKRKRQCRSRPNTSVTKQKEEQTEKAVGRGRVTKQKEEHTEKVVVRRRVTKQKEEQTEKAVGRERGSRSQGRQEKLEGNNSVLTEDNQDGSHPKTFDKGNKSTKTQVKNEKLKQPNKGKRKHVGNINDHENLEEPEPFNCKVEENQNNVFNELESGKVLNKFKDEVSDKDYINPLVCISGEANNVSGFDIDYMSSFSSDDSESEEDDKKLSFPSTNFEKSSISKDNIVNKTSEKSVKNEKTFTSNRKQPEVLHVSDEDDQRLSSEDDFETSQIGTSDRKRKAKGNTSGRVNKEKKTKPNKTKHGKQEEPSEKNAKKGTKPKPKKESNKTISKRKKSNLDNSTVKTHTNSSKVKEETVQVRKNPLKHLDESDVASVLILMEGKKKGDNSDAGPSGFGTVDRSDEESDPSMIESSDEDEEGDWEDVQDDLSQRSPKKNQLPEGGVEITIDAPQLYRKRKKKQFDWKQYVQRQINRFQKGVREDIHKVHLMCLLVRGMYLSRVCNYPQLTAQAISITPDEFSSRRPDSITMATLSRLVKWFKSVIRIAEGQSEENQMKCVLQRDFEEKRANNILELVLLFIVLLRSMGLDVRLVMSLQPMSSKPSKEDASSKSKQKKSLPNGRNSKASKPAKQSTKSKQKGAQHDEDSCSPTKKVQPKKKKKEAKGKSSKFFKNSDSEMEVVKLAGRNKSKKTKEQKCDSEDVEEKYKVKNKSLRERGSKVKPSSYKQENDIDDEEEKEDGDSDESFMSVSDTEVCDSARQKSKRNSKQTQKSRKRKVSPDVKAPESQSSENESDFEPDQTQFRSPLRTKKPLKNNRKVLSSDSDDSSSTAREGCDQWAEVYLETEHKWICVNFVKGELNAPYAIESHASQPVHYVMAYSNKGYTKDVTARYAASWLTDTRKLRADPDWIEETFAPYVDPDTDAGEREDTAIKDNLIRRPMPTSVGAFKGHPLYALKRHLLKFEAIYPNSAVPLGFIRGEPVYARDCVHVLHSRENWLKEGRAVRLGEETYKMVKSRPKWNKPKENPDALDLELFGHWQTEDYIPPPAVDGKVPRNEYGNVELFKESMLPGGTVHLKVPGLNKVAKKLGIDCVPAMMGWDTHCGFSHPILEGFVVCEEHKDILLAAWDEDQEIQRQKEAEKKEKRVIANWKLLTKGLLIKEKLKRRFDLQTFTKASSENHLEKCEDPDAAKAEDVEKSWPRNREIKKKGKKKYSETEVI
ncbi:DNA repair protein complementing XP-C cells-like [Mizuhopecten yessoensis]|nr:DNA repair protein complementing XP-C cells-like [Mizuhopecten yessoensis]